MQVNIEGYDEGTLSTYAQVMSDAAEESEPESPTHYSQYI
jgi:hypothetical protein